MSIRLEICITIAENIAERSDRAISCMYEYSPLLLEYYGVGFESDSGCGRISVLYCVGRGLAIGRSPPKESSQISKRFLNLEKKRS